MIAEIKGAVNEVENDDTLRQALGIDFSRIKKRLDINRIGPEYLPGLWRPRQQT
jgi:hypothetical protein